jgi:hypothetical protein
VNMETVLAGSETANISDNLYFFARLGEGNYAGNAITGGRMQDGYGFRHFLRVCEANPEKEG